MYSYNPANINEHGLDQLRFQLGDTQTDGGAKTCALADEEYLAILAQPANADFHTAFHTALKAIVARFAMSADMKADGIELALAPRYQRWKTMLAECEAAHAFPVAVSAPTRTRPNAPLFAIGMHDNPRAI